MFIKCYKEKVKKIFCSSEKCTCFHHQDNFSWVNWTIHSFLEIEDLRVKERWKKKLARVRKTAYFSPRGRWIVLQISNLRKVGGFSQDRFSVKGIGLRGFSDPRASRKTRKRITRTNDEVQREKKRKIASTHPHIRTSRNPKDEIIPGLSLKNDHEANLFVFQPPGFSIL